MQILAPRFFPDSSALRSALNSWKSGNSSARSGMFSLSHVSVKQRIADPWRSEILPTRDPHLHFSLDSYSHVFSVSTTGIRRYLTLLQPVDRETQDSYTLTLLASDGVQQSVPVTVTITVLDANDNTPTFSNVSYSVNLFTDMLPGETVIQMLAVDSDASENGQVTYRILAGDQGTFLIDSRDYKHQSRKKKVKIPTKAMGVIFKNKA
ncbi:hypothetical protein AMECASPLE_023288 [Ameca splendens]|uniref:Cadherin domain-containing protein n=1 Tax=Ameca splendens TaxID=208324 RepID=A0ABV0ZZK6_9TELE